MLESPEVACRHLIQEQASSCAHQVDFSFSQRNNKLHRIVNRLGHQFLSEDIRSPFAVLPNQSSLLHRRPPEHDNNAILAFSFFFLPTRFHTELCPLLISAPSTIAAFISRNTSDLPVTSGT